MLLQALAAAAGVAGVAGSNEDEAQEVAALIDLRPLRQLDTLVSEAIAPLLSALRKGELESLVLDFEDGAVFILRRQQAWHGG